jgi:hypothetical protein
MSTVPDNSESLDSQQKLDDEKICGTCCTHQEDARVAFSARFGAG